ncbi:enoyl-CoA hydratase family protein [Skermania sp. ID1734]|uniref:enoyl-CoA hydratase family protein n=1 Tax=Skermania sp. ID1734 TaxID=2597516 RepID=UPI00117E6201|nr:enoyl-CoA hydratase family protein [Skermania sp. ID1734]TSD95691.1 enoyl-CoA hydratase family protein [Skermania sp. ID1734]
MGISSSPGGPGVSVITIDYPPVNAFPARGWFDLADAVRSAGRDQSVRAVVIRAENRGFCAGVDIKEIQRNVRNGAASAKHQSLIDHNRGCAEVFSAVYDCQVPVVAAVQGFCLGGGIGIVGNSDIVVAADDATFGLPEVDRGALGAATHLSRLVPQHLMRALFFTAKTITATELHHYGSVYRVVPRAELDSAALEVTAEIAAKDGRVIRAAKEALNGIDLQNVHRSYRFEQGFTFELNLSGAADEIRDRFESDLAKQRTQKA